LGKGPVLSAWTTVSLIRQATGVHSLVTVFGEYETRLLVISVMVMRRSINPQPRDDSREVLRLHQGHGPSQAVLPALPLPLLLNQDLASRPLRRPLRRDETEPTEPEFRAAVDELLLHRAGKPFDAGRIPFRFWTKRAPHHLPDPGPCLSRGPPPTTRTSARA
jgi:hypothetical protein